jgi:hypothetical protein
MNSLERIVAATNLAPVDRAPVIAQVFGHAARLVDLPLRRYLNNILMWRLMPSPRWAICPGFRFLTPGARAGCRSYCRRSASCAVK